MEFIAAKDQDGNGHRIFVAKGREIDNTTLNNPFGALRGEITLRMEDGSPVQYKGKGHYYSDFLGLDFFSDDPEAL